ncbi:SulP family inorganic anion transporter [Cohnella faecalis]|uniref:Sulfate permease n=1 Tax=Cohnella faecalis TaxID=2315694 RepID=A0A398D049_9BACL|nr:sulfate permease [Cohnella faecalis]RIE04544.1 sulfate permease [Cohnella faecalis]
MKWTGRFEGYTPSAIRKDMVSGLIVGIIAIPLGMAFAIASGVKPEYGIYTTIIAGILISMCGGSKFQIGGPTGAFIPILLAIVIQYGYENLLIAGFMAGFLLILMGMLKVGTLIKYIPRPVTIGFTSGISVIIFTGQIGNFLGLRDIEKHESFLLNMKEIGMRLATANIYSIVTGGICLAIILYASKRWPKVPGTLAGLIVSTVAASLLFDGQVATIGSSFGSISSSLPGFHFPELTWDRILALLRPAVIIALLGGIESLLSALVADGMSGTRHNSNRELVGQGIANVIAPLFGGIPATGAIARTAANIKSGAVSPLSGIVHGIVVLLVLLLFAPLASDIPLASMAPILMAVAWNMSERKLFMHILNTKTGDSVVLVLTFALTVFTNLTVAVEAGLVLSVLLFVWRMSQSVTVAKVLPDRSARHEKVKSYMVTEGRDCPQISIYTIEGSLFFGTTNRFEHAVLDAIRKKPGILLLRMSKVPFMDASGEAIMASLVEELEKSGGQILLSGVQPQPLDIMKKTGLLEKIGERWFFEHTGDAIQCAIAHLDVNACLGCQRFAFRECAHLSAVKDGGIPPLQTQLQK